MQVAPRNGDWLSGKPSENMVYSKFSVGNLILQVGHIPSRVWEILMKALGWLHWALACCVLGRFPDWFFLLLPTFF
jgi:hypothetical protein